MAISGANVASVFSGTDATSYATGSYTPTADRLLIAYVENSKSTGTPDTPTLSGNGLTWSQVVTYVPDTSVTQLRMTVFVAKSGSSPSTGAVTADFGGLTQLGCTIVVDQFDGADLSGTALAAIVQNKTGPVDTSGTSESIVLDSAIGSGNATYGAIEHQNTEATTPGSGYTTLLENGRTGPSSRAITEYKVAGSTTVDASWTTSTQKGGIALEIKVAGGEAPTAKAASDTLSLSITDLGSVAVVTESTPSLHPSGKLLLPRISWTIDDIETPLAPDWSANARANFGFEQMRGTLHRVDARRIPSSVGPGSRVKGWTSDGRQIYEGRVTSEPSFQGGLAVVAAQGEAVRAVKRQTRLPYQLRDYGLWTPAQGNPHNYSLATANKVQLAVDEGRIVWSLNDGEVMAIGDDNFVAIWVPNPTTKLTRLQCTWTADRNPAAFVRLDVYKADPSGPSGTGVAVQTNVLSGTSGVIDTGIIANSSDQLMVRFVVASGFTATPTLQVMLTNLRVNGIATGDTFTGSEVVTNVGDQLGFDTTKVLGSGTNVLPLDWVGSWAELLSYMATLDDRVWGVYENDQLLYDDYGSTEWTVYQSDGARLAIDQLEPFNQVTVKYVDVGGAERQVTKTVADLELPDPIPGEVNDYEIVLSDVQPNSDLPNLVAATRLPYVASPRGAGTIEITRAYDAAGREAPFEIRPGHTIRVADAGPGEAAIYRAHDVGYSQVGLSVGTEDLSNVEGLIGRAGLERARAPSTAQLPEVEAALADVSDMAAAEPLPEFASVEERLEYSYGPGAGRRLEGQHRHHGRNHRHSIAGMGHKHHDRWHVHG